MMIKIKGLSEEETSKVIPPNTILLGYVGSIAHGTYIPKTDPNAIDDVDLMGVALADYSVYLGLDKFEQKEAKYKEFDSVVYEIKKFFSLLLKGNPNVLGLLWLKREHYIYQNKYGKQILANRDLFISKNVYQSFAGYAHSQLHKMTHCAYQGYMGAKRKELVDRFGFDCKNAAHLIRLLRMCIEFLTDGYLYVFREDAHELKDIKQGLWPLERVQQESDRLFILAREAYVRSDLPPKPNYADAEDILMEILNDYICQQG